ncbi:MAG TPA: sigma-70 family RNA polymerase sigma factor [Caldilineaceae bacterium]|nr:sigma-70 family RNA polymerase sigma factor [Caldilineaceae bacterium]
MPESTEPEVNNEEQAFIQRAMAGDLDAFNALVLKYQDIAYSVAFRLLRNQDAAADAVQDGFLKAYRALGGFQGGNFRSWLLRIVTNTCYDVLRVRQRRGTDSIDDLTFAQDHNVYLVDHAERPEEYAERMELNHFIEAGIESLPPDQRTVLVLCDIHGYAYDEIAEIVDLPMGTVKSRISRARSRLRDYLQNRPELLPSSFRP